jgi:hypothetical protein
MRLAGFLRLRRVGFAPKVPVRATSNSSLVLAMTHLHFIPVHP